MKRIALTIAGIVLMSHFSNAQIRTYTSTEEDSIACVQNLSLYIEYFKQNNFNDAAMGWRKAASICPKATESLWINGVKIYQELIDKAEDPEKKNALIDTLAWVYDQRIVNFGKEGYVLGRKGSDMLKYRPDAPKAAFDDLYKSLQLQGTSMEAGASIYLYKAAYDMYRNKEVEKLMLFDLYAEVSESIDYNLSNQTDERMIGAYQMAQDNVDKMFIAIAECSDLVEHFTNKFESIKGDAKALKQLIRAFEKKDCTDESIYQQAAIALFDLEPSATAAYAIANGFARKDNFSKAYEFYTKAIDMATETEIKAKAISQAAKISLVLGNYVKAKSLALDLLKINPNDGEAYIIIGNAYAKGRNECGSNECENRAAYWAAVDKYQQAKAVDPSVAEQAQTLINTYTAQFPKKEDCFFHGINDGTTYTFDCWIGETTTVRTRAN